MRTAKELNRHFLASANTVRYFEFILNRILYEQRKSWPDFEGASFSKTCPWLLVIRSDQHTFLSVIYHFTAIAQTDLRLCCSHRHKAGFLMTAHLLSTSTACIRMHEFYNNQEDLLLFVSNLLYKSIEFYLWKRTYLSILLFRIIRIIAGSWWN